MPLSVYIETTIVSYLTARPSRDLVIRAHQRLTREWWRDRRTDFALHISPLVLQEARMGDRRVARRRLRALRGIPVLAVTPGAIALARRLVRRGPIPERAEVDALHIATAPVHGMDYLVTWNCRHIANAMMRNLIEALCRLGRYEPPITKGSGTYATIPPDPLVRVEGSHACTRAGKCGALPAGPTRRGGPPPLPNPPRRLCGLVRTVAQISDRTVCAHPKS